jgi:hypothetical protein
MYKHPSNTDMFNEWRLDNDYWLYVLFERDNYYI